MPAESSIFQIPNQFSAPAPAPAPSFATSEDQAIFNELNYIAEEIDRCRATY